MPMSSHVLAPSRATGDLDEAVAAFLHEGILQGEPGCLIAAPEVVPRIDEALARRDLSADAARADGRLVTVPLPEALDRLPARPVAADLEALVTVALAGPRRRSLGAPLRIASELTCRLWADGERQRALAVEVAWHEWLRVTEASVLCTCGADALDPEEDARTFLAVCRAHGRFQSPSDGARRQAIAAAIDGVLGVRDAVRLHSVLGGAGLPVATEGMEEMALIWLRTEVPHLAQRVVHRANDILAGRVR